jgi:hypothetical protein
MKKRVSQFCGAAHKVRYRLEVRADLVGNSQNSFISLLPCCSSKHATKPLVRKLVVIQQLLDQRNGDAPGLQCLDQELIEECLAQGAEVDDRTNVFPMRAVGWTCGQLRVICLLDEVDEDVYADGEMQTASVPRLAAH